MNTSPHAPLWPDVVAEQEGTFIPAYLKKSVDYLVDSRESRKGWPPYVGLPSDLHSSSVVIAALRSLGDDSVGALIVDGAVYVRQVYGMRAKQAPIEELLDLIRVAHAEDRSSDYAKQLRGRLFASAQAVKDGNRSFSTAVASRALLESAAWEENSQLAQPWQKALLDRQDAETGGWPLVEDSNEVSITATAWAVRSLAIADSEGSEVAVSGGLQYIESLIRNRGWTDIFDSQGMYTVALVLQAVSSTQLGDQGIINDGVQLVRTRMNEDGGWGGGPGDPSGIEYTAAVVMALVESGENRFLPTRVVKEALADLQLGIREIVADRDSLRDAFERRVLEHCGHIKHERDGLQEKISQAESEAKALNKRLRELERNAALYRHGLARIRTGRPLPKALLAAAAVTLVAIVCAPYFFSDTIATIVSGTLAVLLVAGGVFYALGQRTIDQRRNLHRGLAFDEAVMDLMASTPTLIHKRNMTRLLDDFRYATENLPPGTREELVYRLLREGAHIPPDIGPRYIRELLLELHIPPRESQRLEVWLETIMILEPDGRRALLTQLRRVIL
ncbi:prenyltransferase/squalene oxidase repeat-containing protein [Streptomyces cellulosae]|uniref:prenyltransferase/squalene oxidase repeat-containing protein n=1 Tax=Streptomyces cellulosae TaxID=1968 RepID=UPI00099BF3AA|nr:prenyltransferase/squalene oxidase repeat-containing protein [Streptomyces cellulosae]